MLQMITFIRAHDFGELYSTHTHTHTRTKHDEGFEDTGIFVFTISCPIELGFFKMSNIAQYYAWFLGKSLNDVLCRFPAHLL
jgi:hypothetical protein